MIIVTVCIFIVVELYPFNCMVALH